MQHTDPDAFPDPTANSSGVAGRDDAARADKLRRQLRERFGAASGPAAAPAVVARAPGRVNLIGGHTDYSGGYALPTTIDRAAYVAVRRRSDDQVGLYATAFDEEVSYGLAEGPPRGGWAAYAGGVADVLCRRERLGSGFEAIIDGDVPLGAGLSSSAALEMAAAVALDMLFADVAADGPLAPVETAQLGQQVEHEYAGVECGIMDQFAARLGRAGHALFLDCRSLSHEHVPLQLEERDAALVVADTNVRRELAASKYNERRTECQRAAAVLRDHTGEEIETLRDVTPAMLETAAGDALSGDAQKRARHVVSENQRVLDAKAYLEAGDLDALGDALLASHASLRDDYSVSSDELDALVEAARATDGVFGARMTGAGFGGCTVTLARRQAVERFQEHARERFGEQFDQEPTFYVIENNVEAGMVG